MSESLVFEAVVVQVNFSDWNISDLILLDWFILLYKAAEDGWFLIHPRLVYDAMAQDFSHRLRHTDTNELTNTVKDLVLSHAEDG